MCTQCKNGILKHVIPWSLFVLYFSFNGPYKLSLISNHILIFFILFLNYRSIFKIILYNYQIYFTKIFFVRKALDTD